MNRQMRWGILLVVLGMLVSAPLSAQTFSALNASGSGRNESNCFHTFFPGCTVSASGTSTGTPIGGDWILRLDIGGPTSQNGSTTSPQGVCIPGAGAGTITETGGDTLSFNAVGTVCEEGVSSGPYVFIGTYRITGGTGRFAAAIGTGSASAAYGREGTFTRGAGYALLQLTGSISY